VNKSDLVNSLSKDLKWSKAKTERVLDAFFGLVSETYLEEEEIKSV
jgi:nucleoid DNA-binding protein